MSDLNQLHPLALCLHATCQRFLRLPLDRLKGENLEREVIEDLRRQSGRLLESLAKPSASGPDLLECTDGPQ